MPRHALPTSYHERLHLPDYDQRLTKVAIADLNTGGSDSPSEVWARERLRAELDLSYVDKTQVDLLVWGRGEPRQPAGTKIGGRPVWPIGKSFPVEERNDWELPGPLRFFGQFNFADSLDLLPELPEHILSVWGSQQFPYHEDSIQTYWLDPAESALAVAYEHPFYWRNMPSIPFHAVLHRSWERSRRQELLDAAAVEPVRKDRSCATSWAASKMGGSPTLIQSDEAPTDSHFFLQMKSIEPAHSFPHPWVNVVEPFTMDFPENEYHHEKNELMLGDGGFLYFHLTSWGTVTTVFEYH